MITLEVRHLTRRFDTAQYAAVNDISFELEIGEILVLVGPSGCGKTTTLRMIAGFEHPDSGLIRLNGHLLASETEFVPPERRGIGMVFQDHALFPHLTVFENVAFGLQGRKSAEIRSTVAEMLQLVGMEALASRYPHELSGGECQRVALVRALAPQPALLLLDEPFSSLDADLRGEVREQVRNILKSIRASVIFVTHDQEEALFMGDRLAVLQRGRLEQIGAPEQIYHSSATHFVAEFMGDSDFLKGKAIPEGIYTEVGLLSQIVKVNGSAQVEVALRGDDIDFDPAESGNGVIIERFFRGAFNVYRLRLDSGQVLHAFKDHTLILPVGTRVRAYIRASHPLGVFHEGRAVS
jgi:iron(III) transport system ATP-binding protein